MNEFTNEDFLAALREAQESASPRGPGSFGEWRQERFITKTGGANAAHISPGFGLMGGHLNTSSRAPYGPPNRPSGNNAVGLKQLPQQFGVPSGVDAMGEVQSKYDNLRPNQPPPWIDDVNMASVWYSPMEPVWPFGPPYYNVPREWNFPVGYNLNYVPQRLELMGTLRGMRQSWGVLSTVIQTRKDQLLRVPWTIQVRDKPRTRSSAVAEVQKFFRKPDGKLSYSQWAKKLLDDLFVIDAPTLYMDRDLGGKLRNAQVLDGGSIFPLIDDAGRRPDSELRVNPDGLVYEHRQPAFQQIIYGLPMINLSEDELIYAMANPRPELPIFGYSQVEQIMIEATEAIRKTFYQLEFWRCYDESTEVLTRRGWLPFILTTEDDEFATRNPATKVFEWQKSTDSFREYYDGKMIKFSGQKIDLLVTPNHKMILSGLPRALGGNTWRKGEVEVQAHQLLFASTTNCGVPITSKWVGEEIRTITFGDDGLEDAIERDDTILSLRKQGYTLDKIGQMVGLGMQTVWETLKQKEEGWTRTKVRSGGSGQITFSGDSFCAFMGMWLSEGWIHNGTVVCIAQQPTSKGYIPFKELLISILGQEPYYDGKGWQFGSVHLAKFLSQFGHAHQKYVPDELMEATPKQIETFFKYYYYGDGAEQTKIMYTTSKRMADQFVELAQKMGRNASMNVDDRRGKIVGTGKNGNIYRTTSITYGVRIYDFGEYTKGFDVGVEEYAGYVSCVTVPNGTLLVRRNNKAVWSGNSGSMPEMIITVPDNWTPRQIATFQAHFDALLSGQLTLKSKVRFVPGGMKPFDIKNASGESLWSQRDELLVRLCCYAFSVSPTPFIKQSNRATASIAQETAEEEGLYPLMSYWKDDIMDVIIQDKMGFEDIEFVFLPRPTPDQNKQSQIHQIQIDEGIRSRNEVRAELGEEPIPGGDVYTVKTTTGVVRLDQIISGEALAATSHGGAPSGEEPKPSSTPSNGPSPGPVRGPARPRQASPIPSPTPVHKLSGKDIADAAKDAERDPSKLKRKVGNYPKGHISIRGLPITIENAKGSRRGEKDRFGREQNVRMPAAYGYIRGTNGADNMQVDCYIGKHPKSPTIWVIDQDKVDPNGDDKGFDEHKVMIAYDNPKKAIKNYLKSHFDGLGHERLAAVTQVSYDELKNWLKDGDMKRPISEQGVGHVVARRGVGGGVNKADTVSQSTGLLSYDQNTAVPRKKRKKRKRLNQGPRWLELCA